jgi:hypothetical protein
MISVKQIMNVDWLWDIRVILVEFWLNKLGKSKDSEEYKRYQRIKKNRADGCNYVLRFNDYWWMLNIIKQIAVSNESAPHEVIRWIENEQAYIDMQEKKGFTLLCMKIDVVEKGNENEQ